MSQRISAGELSGSQFHDPYSYPYTHLCRTYVNRGRAKCAAPYGFVPAEVSSLW